MNDRLKSLLTQDRHAEAIGLYESMPVEARAGAEATNLYACALIMAGQAERAFDLLNAVPDGQKSLNMWNNLCAAGLQLERFEETRAVLDAALQAHPANQALLVAQARCLSSLGRLEEAYDCARAAAARAETDEALCAAGLAAEQVGRYDDAAGFYRRALAANPEHGAAANNLNSLCWRLRQFSDVRELAEARLWSPTNHAGFTRYLAAGCAPWTGGRLDGQRLHVIADQGVGDQIMFTQFLGRLGAFGAGQVVVHLEPRLVPLFREGFRSDFTVAFEPIQAKIECGPADRKVPLSSLPNYFVHSADDFPRKAFLSLDAGSGDLRRSDPRRLFGLAWWSAGLASEARSLDVIELAEALQATGARFLSLQYRPADAGIERLQALLGDRLIVPDGLDCTDDFLAVAKTCLQLDGILTVPQALVHLAGAVGVPVGVLLPEDPSWRYDSPDEAMLWYGDHVRLIQQDRSSSLKRRIASFLDIPRV